VRRLCIIAVFVFASCATPQPKSYVNIAGSMQLNVEFQNHRYVAVASYFRFADGHDDSCVILIPGWNRPSLRFDVDYGVNSVVLGWHRHRFAGRYVGITDEKGTSLKLLPSELPATAFKRYDSFKPALLKCLRRYGEAKEI
jgi:hypothetical protein